MKFVLVLLLESFLSLWVASVDGSQVLASHPLLSFSFCGCCFAFLLKVVCEI